MEAGKNLIGQKETSSIRGATQCRLSAFTTDPFWSSLSILKLET